MSPPRLTLCVLIFLLPSGFYVHAGQTDQEAKLEEVVNTIGRMASLSGETIPHELIETAKGIAIVPSVVKVGLLVGERYGKGVLSARRPTGEWSRPLFVSLSGGDVGWQIGAQSVDVILLFASRRAVDVLISGELKLGVDALVAPGPVGSAAESGDADEQTEVHAYSISRGLLAGIDLKRTRLRVEPVDNDEYYLQAQIMPAQVLDDDTYQLPGSAGLLKRLLKEITDN